MESHGMCSFSEFFIIENSHTYKTHTHTHNCPKNKAMVNYNRNYKYI